MGPLLRDRPPPARWLANAPVSVAIVAAEVLVQALVAWRLGDATTVGVLVRAGALERSRVWSGEWWRLASAIFLHVGWIHLAWNAAFGLGWCRVVERALGSARFLGLYLAAGIAASSVSLVVQDVPSAGASGALFGMVGAALALHRRRLGSWRLFARSGATRQVAISLAIWTAVVVGAHLPVDHAAHAGGLVAGAAGAWLLTRPPPRSARPWLATAAALAVLVGAAVWPRAGLSAYATGELTGAIFDALDRGDDRTAGALLDRADRAGLRGDDLGYYHGLLDVQRGDLAGAAARLEPVAATGDPRIRPAARKALASVARTLAYRSYTGDGAPRDPERGLRWFDVACRSGDAASCRDADRIRGR